MLQTSSLSNDSLTILQVASSVSKSKEQNRKPSQMPKLEAENVEFIGEVGSFSFRVCG